MENGGIFNFSYLPFNKFFIDCLQGFNVEFGILGLHQHRIYHVTELAPVFTTEWGKKLKNIKFISSSV